MRTLLAFLLGLVPVLSWANEPADGLTFEQHVHPIFRAYCFDCHGAGEEKEGELDLRLVRWLKAGGESGAAIVPGRPDESLLLQRVKRGEMPPGETRVRPDEIAILERWIAEGAMTARPEPETLGPGVGITYEERQFWSFQPIRRPPTPPLDSFTSEQRVRTPIDALVLQAAPPGSQFAPDADRATLIKRAYFDLLGLPPAPEAMRTWQADASGDWYERLLDELLQSPHYGERWGRHWLDIAGYADSEGYTIADAERPWAWKYRDWVIAALNADLPFDRFITEQLAGDELAGPIQGDLTADQIRLLTATGFLRMAADGTGSGADTPDARNQVMADTLKIVGTSLLALSLQCAQCHDHRYDPIPQRDYYSIRAVFEPSLDWRAWKSPAARQVSLYTAADRAKAAEIEAEVQQIAAERGTKQQEYLRQALDKELMKFEEPLRTELRTAYETPDKDRTAAQNALLDKHPSVRITPGVLYQYLPEAAEDLKKYDERMNQTRARKPAEEFLQALVEPADHRPPTLLFYRGDHQQPREPVAPGPLSVTLPADQFAPFPEDDPSLPTSGRRLAFARWLTSPEQPLFARVMVNRIWLHHFGEGLVTTPADFGKLGARPNYPQLLDWLAVEFREQGWSLKKFHKQIMTSTVYRQASMPAEASGVAAETATAETATTAETSVAVQPVNSSASNPADLDTASPADTASKSSMRLLSRSLHRLEAEAIRDRMLAVSGQLDVALGGRPLEIKEDETGQVEVSGEQKRRSLYIQVRRSRPIGMLQNFDAPVMETNCELRPNSTVATQSLMLLNGGFTLAQAARFAARTAQEPSSLSAEQRAALPPLPPFAASAWQYGFGAFDTEQNRTASFTRLEHWTGSQWQAGANLPDPQQGWVLLHANGGHPDIPERAVIRRWQATQAGTVTIRGELSHGSPNGDGVRGRIISSRNGKLGEWVVQNGQAETAVATFDVQPGDFLDFLTDCRENQTSDSFNWPVTLTLQVPGQAVREIASQRQFQGPAEIHEQLPARHARAWELALCRTPTHEEMVLATEFVSRQIEFYQSAPERLPEGRTAAEQAMINFCQTLLTCNEFLYVE